MFTRGNKTPLRCSSSSDLLANWVGLPFCVTQARRRLLCFTFLFVPFPPSRTAVCRSRDGRHGGVSAPTSSHGAGTERNHSCSSHTPGLGWWLRVACHSGLKMSWRVSQQIYWELRAEAVSLNINCKASGVAYVWLAFHSEYNIETILTLLSVATVLCFSLNFFAYSI